MKLTELVFVLVVLVVVALITLAISIAKRRRTSEGELKIEWPFYAKHVLSKPEQVLYHRLVTALPEYIVLAQVQASRVLGVKKGFNFNEWNNRINRLSYDFVICAKDLTVLAVVELDDKSHEATSRAETDEKKNKATSAAGIRLIRWHVKAIPDQMQIQSMFAEPQIAPSRCSVDG